MKKKTVLSLLIVLVAISFGIVALSCLLGYWHWRHECLPNTYEYWRAKYPKDNLSIDFDVPPDYVPIYTWADDMEKDTLRSAWAEAATNLVAGDIKGVAAAISSVSNRMKSVCAEQWLDVVMPYYETLQNRLRTDKLNDNYASVDEFDSYMSDTFAGMNIMGEIELLSPLTHSSTGGWEPRALTMVKAYHLKFTENGLHELAQRAEKFKNALIEQIESEHGLTRRYMYKDLQLQMQLVERGASTTNQVLRGVITDAYPLKVAGYEPDWLDEFKPQEKDSP